MKCDLPRVYEEKQLKARKQHICCECHVPINKGEEYIKCSGNWDGKFEHYKQHLVCRNACVAVRDFPDTMHDEGIPFGNLLCDYKDWLDTFYSRNVLSPEEKEFRFLVAQVLKRRRKFKKEGTQ